MANEHLGRDIRLVAGDLAPYPAGDVETVQGLACLRQDLALRLTTPLGSWRFDAAFGTRVYRYLKGPNTELTRRAMAQDLRLDCEADTRVEPGSTTAEIVEWDRRRIVARITLQPRGSSNRLSLVIGYMDNGQVEVQ
ncbi:MAG: hypothetical protein ACOY94_19555 [Bacillota bacterium]